MLVKPPLTAPYTPRRSLSSGFEVRDAIALLRLDDLYVECFEVKDVKVRALLCGGPEVKALVERGVASRASALMTAGDPPTALRHAQTLRGEHLSRAIGRLAGKVCCCCAGGVCGLLSTCACV